MSSFRLTRTGSVADQQKQNNGILLPQIYSLESNKPTANTWKEVSTASHEPMVLAKLSMASTSFFEDAFF